MNVGVAGKMPLSCMQSAIRYIYEYTLLWSAIIMAKCVTVNTTKLGKFQLHTNTASTVEQPVVVYLS